MELKAHVLVQRMFSTHQEQGTDGMLSRVLHALKRCRAGM